MDIDQEGSSIIHKAKALYARKDYRAAAEGFAEAAVAYTTAGDVLMAAEMKNNQSVALLQAKDGSGAFAAVSGTAAVFAAAGDLRRQGMALANEAAALENLKKIPEALALYEQSAALLDQAGETQLRADVMRSVATLKIRRGEGGEAVIAMQDGLARLEKPTLKQRILKKLLRFRFF